MIVHISITPDFEPGDQPPKKGRYLDWHAWAEVQHEAGLEQEQCPRCFKWRYPQESCRAKGVCDD